MTIWSRERRIPLPAAPDRAALLALLGLVAILYQPLLFGGVLFERDIHLVWHAQAEVFVRSVLSGAWPVWDPWTGFGQPYLANPNAQVYYPLTWLQLLFPPWAYYSLFVVAHAAFSAVGFYLLGRRWSLSRGAAFTAAALWSASGPLLSLVSVWHHFGASAWIPWVLLAAEASLGSDQAWRALLWGAALALQVLAGSPDVCALTLLLVTGYTATRLEWKRPWFSSNRGPIRSVAIAWGAAAGLSAAQWLPTLALAVSSARFELAEAKRMFWSVHPAALLQLLFPLSFDDLPRYAPQTATLYDLWTPFLHSLYLGLPAAILVAAAFTAQGRGRRGFLAGVVLASLLFALGGHTPAYALVVGLLPPLKILRYPAKAAILACFAWAALAGIGFDAWREPPSRRRWALLLAGFGAATAAGVVVTLLRQAAAESWGPLLLAHVPLAAGLAIAALAAAVVRWRRPGESLGPAVTVAVLAVVDLLAAHHDLNPTTRKEFFLYRPEILQSIPAQPAPRIYVWDYVLQPPGRLRQPNRIPIFYETPKGWPPRVGPAMAMQMYLYPPSQGRWRLYGSYNPDLLDLGGRALYDMNLALRAAEGTPAFSRLLRLASVDYVVSLQSEGLDGLLPTATLPGLYSEPIRVHRVPDPLPRTYAVGAARIADGPEAVRTLVDPAFDPAREVVLPAGAPPPASAAFAGISRILEVEPDRVRLEATLSEPGYVVLADGYEPGWRATLDGQPCEILRANMIFRAVRTPAGTHVVEYRYRPPSVVVGFALSALSLLGVVGIGLRSAGR